MPQTFTRNPALAAPVVPELVQVYEHTREVRTVVHPIVGRADVEATLRAAGLRQGTLVAVFGTEADAREFDAALAEVGVWTLVDSDVTAASMTFIVQQSIALALDEQTMDTWLVTVGFLEVVA